MNPDPVGRAVHRPQARDGDDDVGITRRLGG